MVSIIRGLGLIKKLSFSLLLFFIFLLPLFAYFFSFVPSSAEENNTSPWLINGSAVFENLGPSVLGNQVPAEIYGNKECSTKEKVVIRPAKKPIPFVHLGQPEKSEYACTFNTQYGTSYANSLIRNGTNISGKVYKVDNTHTFKGIPNSNNGISYREGRGGEYFTLEKDVSSRLKTDIDRQTGEVKHFLEPGESIPVIDELGQPMDVMWAENRFSGNGKWMIFDANGVGLTRLNAETGEILIFSEGFRYDIQQGPNPSLTISGDGRYAVVMSAFQKGFRLFDLSTCVESPQPNKPANCEYRDLTKDLKELMPDHNGWGRAIAFVDDYTLRFYGQIRENGNVRYSKQLLSAPGHTPTEFGYLGLGDSFSSGEGAYNYRASTDLRNPLNKCHVSLDSYPFLVGSRLNLNQFESVACSGAKIKDVNGQYLKDYLQGNAQAEGLNDNIHNDQIFNNFLPGYRMQKQFVEKYRPSHITISISGNDAGFGTMTRNCVFWADDCYSETHERVKLVSTVNDRFQELVNMYSELKDLSPKTTIYALGYPQLVKEGGDCGSNVRVSNNEIEFFNNFVDYLNYVIEKAAQKAGVYYVDVSSALYGHKLCEGPTHELAVNGLTVGNDKVFDLGPFGNESYHPNKKGHGLLAKAIIDKTENFSKKNPLPDSSINNPGLHSTQASKLTGQISPSELVEVKYSQVSNLTNEPLWEKSLTGHKYLVEGKGFAPEQTVYVEAFSEPTSLGGFLADEEGNVTIELEAPNLPVGYHTLQLSGENIAGETIAQQQQIFIAYSEDDLDGDQIPNEEDACMAIEPSGTDEDQDGIDDACDGFIDEAPTPEPTPEPEPEEEDPKPWINNNETVAGLNEPKPGTISGVNPTNSTNQAPQTASSLQPGATQAQNTGGSFQVGAPVQGENNTAVNELLNQGLGSAAPLSVGVASANANNATTTAPYTPPKQPGSASGEILVALVVVGIFGLFLAYKKKVNYGTSSPTFSEEVIDPVITTKPTKDKKAKKKKKKPHHR